MQICSSPRDVTCTHRLYDTPQAFAGPGSATFNGVDFARNFGLLSAWGIGGQVASQSGVLDLIGAPSSTNAGLPATWFLGHQFWLGCR
jgi:hypothetical protein